MDTRFMLREVQAVADLAPLLDLVGGHPAYLLTRINVPTASRSLGYGSALLRRVLAAADAEAATVQLEVSPSDGLTRLQLVKWYRRYGFIGIRLMTRLPLPVVPGRGRLPTVPGHAVAVTHVMSDGPQCWYRAACECSVRSPKVESEALARGWRRYHVLSVLFPAAAESTEGAARGE